MRVTLATLPDSPGVVVVAVVGAVEGGGREGVHAGAGVALRQQVGAVSGAAARPAHYAVTPAVVAVTAAIAGAAEEKSVTQRPSPPLPAPPPSVYHTLQSSPGRGLGRHC